MWENRENSILLKFLDNANKKKPKIMTYKKIITEGEIAYSIRKDRIL